MKISIITVSYNSAKTIGETIRSVQEQVYPDIEYIICDGASKDTTLEIINNFNNLGNIRLISEPDKGIYDAMNKGLKIAEGDVIGFLNSDDFYCGPSVISKVAECFQQTGCDALYGDLYYVDHQDINKVVRIWKAGPYKKNSFKFGWMPPHPTFFVRKEVYERYGGFNTLLKSAADYELMLRFIYKNQIKISYLPIFMVKMRAGGVSNASWKNRIRANNEDKFAWKLNKVTPYFFTTWLKPIRKITQFLIK